MVAPASGFYTLPYCWTHPKPQAGRPCCNLFWNCWWYNSPHREDNLERTGSWRGRGDRKSTRLNSSHVKISYAVFCLKKKKKYKNKQKRYQYQGNYQPHTKQHT